MLDVRIDEFLASDFQLSMVERPKIPTAKRKVEHIEVPGRHGSLTKKGAYEDVPFTIKFNLLEDENIKPLIRRMKSWLLNGKILHFNDDIVYRKIKNVEIDDIENDIEEYGYFEVKFTLDPFEYAEDESITIYEQGLIYNPGTFESEPKMWIVAKGTVNITINDITFQLKDIESSVVVDSEILEAYIGTVPMNNKMVGDFPIFNVGSNRISWSGTVQSITIRPRWRYV
ncbi:phage tail family protein [Bacillus sp. Xin]|uniref:distal tail protein Dit n=1 Tax=unclassified Bacillus (in: firmicutes) TaxID=185979 RepID=UPI001572AEFF|nr:MULTISPECIES: distal tail protein Dit [unclassified Bacillus (in: firmicutes)]MBC6973043.1 phage tail family protein [Bacillus sp. Xin]NSW37690.1 phage tail family protein [Bacillus sp. Xin1]